MFLARSGAPSPCGYCQGKALEEGVEMSFPEGAVTLGNLVPSPHL